MHTCKHCKEGGGVVEPNGYHKKKGESVWAFRRKLGLLA